MADKFSGPQKAAIFLLAIGEEIAAEIVKGLNDEEIKKLGTSLAKIPSVTPRMVEAVFGEFHEIAANGPTPLSLDREGNARFIKSLLTKSIEGGKAQTLLEEIKEESLLGHAS